MVSSLIRLATLTTGNGTQNCVLPALTSRLMKSIFYEQQSRYFNHPPVNDLPERPKRPPSSWTMFFKEKRDNYKQKYTDKTTQELTKIMAQDWKNTDKTPYIAASKQAFAEYKSKMKDFMNSLTEEQRYSFETITKRNAIADKACLKELIEKTYLFPKRPRKSIHIFISIAHKHIKTQCQHMKQIDILNALVAHYKTLSEYEKQEYLRLEAMDKERFRREFIAWYEEVLDDPEISDQAKGLAYSMKMRYKSWGYL